MELNAETLEKVRAMKDPKFYLENFCQIKTKNRKFVPFILNEAQKDLYNTLVRDEAKRVILLKARQLGFSTAICGFFYHDTITNPGTTSVIIGYNREMTTELLEKVKLFYNTTPEALRPEIKYNSRYEMSFPKLGSKILVLPSNSTVGRGYTINNLLCVSGETEVLVVGDQVRKVSELKEGELIMNGGGGYSPIKKIISKLNDKRLLTIKPMGVPALTLTEDHKVLTRTFKSGKPSWEKSSNLTLDNYMAFPCSQGRECFKFLEITHSWIKGKEYYWTPIKSIVEAPQEELVYDIVLPNDPHSFVTTSGIVSNCTELALWDKAEEKMMTLESSVPIDGRIVVESTPNSIGNLYHEMWVRENDYIKKEYGWWWAYTEEEIETIKRRMNNPQKFAQEYACHFLASGRLVFDSQAVLRQRKNILKTEDLIKQIEGVKSTQEKVFLYDGMRVYRQPTDDGIYVCGVDNSEGVEGGDYTVVTFFNRKTGEEVGFYRGLIAPDRLAIKLNAWGRYFKNALMCVEINNHGLSTITELKHLMYPNFYFRPSKFDVLGMTSSDKMGWRTTPITKPLMIDDLNKALRDDIITIHSKETLDEMLTFIYSDSGDMQPTTRSYHDDTIFATAVAFQGFKVLVDKAPTQLNFAKYLPSNFSY